MNKDILWHVHDYGRYIRDMANDGFTQFEVKKKLYLILWEAEKQLKDSPKFLGEEEWISENRQ